jgi:hypothetical protein
MQMSLRALGIVVPVAAGLGFMLVGNIGIFGPGQTPNSPVPSGSPLIQPSLLVSTLLVEVVAGMLSGFLLRSLWALLVVPIGLVLGTIAGIFLAGTWYAATASDFVVLLILMIVGFGVASLPSVAAAALGAQLGKRFFGPTTSMMPV